jgi:hypothetical protein
MSFRASCLPVGMAFAGMTIQRLKICLGGGNPGTKSARGRLVRGKLVYGDMAELVDALASGASSSNTVRVRISLSPQIKLH